MPALEAVTKASVPNSKALHSQWIQWVLSLTAINVNFVFEPSLQMQEFLQYEHVYPVSFSILALDE